MAIGARISENALKVMEKRCFVKDAKGVCIEDAKGLFLRVAKAVAAADELYGKSQEEVKNVEGMFYQMMSELLFLPNSPTLMNAARPLGQLSACFVLPVGDSMEEIFDAVKYSAVIHKSGGGTGFSFSRLRPSGDTVASTAGVSSGPTSFMQVFNAATETVKQGGKRRGANMGMLRVDHPDILKFIVCKDDNNVFNNFNISVGITKEFMEALKADGEYETINPRTREFDKRLKARDVFNEIAKQAWKNGEPGVVFLDKINEANPTPKLGEFESTNPCGEQPLLPYESCNLGSINLGKMVNTETKEVQWAKLRDVTRAAVHFLDNVIDVNIYPLPAIAEKTRGNRKIGLGVMGWADMLIQLGIPYNSEKAIHLAEEVMGSIQKVGGETSAELAVERGVFPNYHDSIYAGGSLMLMRNATITTIAPTGTLSIIAGCSSGIEPLFAVSFVKTVLDGAKLIEVNPYFEEIAKERSFWSPELMEEIAEKGSILHIDGIPEDVKEIFVTAHDISSEAHVEMQAAFQKHVDNAVSKTLNFRKDVSLQDVEKAYLLAYDLGCKGVTVYRDGSRAGQVLSTGDGKGKETAVAVSPSSPIQITPRKRASSLLGSTDKYETGCGDLYITVNMDEMGCPFEVFTAMGKAGGCAASQCEAVGRLASLALRSGINVSEVIKQVKGISCHQPAWGSGGGRILSCADAVGKALEAFEDRRESLHEFMENLVGRGSLLVRSNHKKASDVITHMGACPECGGGIEHEGGCEICKNCGYSRC